MAHQKYTSSSLHRKPLTDAEFVSAGNALLNQWAADDARTAAMKQQQALQQAQQQAADDADWARIRQDTQFEETRMQLQRLQLNSGNQ